MANVPHGIGLVGVPVDPVAVEGFCADYARAAVKDMPGALIIDFLPHVHFGPQGPYPNAALGEVPVITTDAPDASRTLAETSLAHELTHVLFGDPTHTREELWGCPGLLSRFLGYCEGWNPANR